VLGLELGLVSEVVAAFKATAMLPRSQGLRHAFEAKATSRTRTVPEYHTPVY